MVSVVISLLHSRRFLVRSRASLHLEILVLRHQLAVVDRRADIWAFGVVLHEMLTGRRMYDAETAAETLARIVEREPDLKALPSATPAPVRHILERCLTKDPLQRVGEFLAGWHDRGAGR